MPCEIFRTPCQFNQSESDLIDCSGRPACKFHLPLIDSKKENTVKAKWRPEELQAFNKDILESVDTVDVKVTRDFSGVVFPGAISFSGRQIDFNFDQAVFHEKADFKNTIFVNKGSFKETTFHAEVNFQEACFNDSISFCSAEFNGPCNFTGANFQGVDFHKAIFREFADFTDTRFLTHMRFVNTRFLSRASFDRVTTDEEHSYFFPFTNFSKSIFKESVSFINRTFSTTTNFEGCVFHVVPKFQGCKLHQDTIFPLERNFKDHSKSAAPSYRTLKLDMENSRARQEEAMFNALEQRCQVADPETPFMVKCFSRLYGYTSGYGQSLGWPIFWMGIFSLIFFGLYRYLSIFPITELSWKSLVPVIGFTIEQSVSPFKVWRLSGLDSPGWLCSSIDLVLLKIIATVHSLFFLAFFGLFILVLRWRFKRG